MQSFHACIFLAAVRMLQSVGISKSLHLTDDTVWSAKQRDTAQHFLIDFEKDCIEGGFTLPASSLRRLITLLGTPNCTDAKIYELADEINGRLVDEMQFRVFFSLSDREAEYYNRWWEGWEEIISRFPATMSDVEEAVKCFSLSRYTAAIFHSTQVIEVGVIGLGIFLGVNDPKAGWTPVTNSLNMFLKKDYKSLSKIEKQYRNNLEQIHGTIEALKNAWRNKIAHAQGRLLLMGTDFTPDIAEEILLSSRAFMRRLSTDIPEGETITGS